MITGLSNYKLLFMAQLLLGEGLFLFRLERKPQFRQRAGICVAVLLSLAWAFPSLDYNAWYLSAMFLTLFLCTLAGLAFCFDEPFENILFCGFAGYTLHHLSYLLYTVFNDATQFGRIFGNIIDPYDRGVASFSNLGVLQAVFYVDIYFLIYTCAFELFDGMLRRNHDLRLGRMSMIALSGLLLITDVITNMITVFYTASRTVSFILEHGYNILLCILVLNILYGQLNQKDLRDHLSGLQHYLEQEGKRYELAKSTIDLINIKYHDLRHRSQSFDTRGEQRELDRVLDDYACLVQTGNEMLDVLLTEKTLRCRERGIQLLCMADGSQLNFMQPHHLYALLDNAIDNAIEAVVKLPPEERIITLYVRNQGSVTAIHIENPFNGFVTMRNGLPVTSKEDKDYHGYGTLSIRTVAEQYGGGVTIDASDGVFRLDILLCPSAAILPD